MKFDIHKKNGISENGAGKTIFDHYKLKIWTCFWGQGECEWPLDVTNGWCQFSWPFKIK